MPLVASIVLIITLTTCLILTLVMHRYIGGLKVPYFSDLGRDPPSYYVFGIGLSIVALSIAVTWILNYEYQAASLQLRVRRGQMSKWLRLVWARIVLTAGVLSTIGLPTLAFCSTTSCPSVHVYATFWFFLLEILAILINTTISWRLLQATRHYHHRLHYANDANELASVHQTVSSLRRTVVLQTVTSAVLMITVLAFIPIGIAVLDDDRRLPIRDCLNKQLGTKYCTSTMQYNNNETKLWKYDTHFVAHQIRAVCEWATMIALVAYSLSFLLYRDYELETEFLATTNDNNNMNTTLLP
uniref:CWH43-like N-terminal domain-containing protein n=1 Tax=Globisporangium ultimum (strain ATCC 200006 / CBS 805.95 / DAOM BR144) TaxID=431595 RepID=K3X860_GLOUD